MVISNTTKIKCYQMRQQLAGANAQDAADKQRHLDAAAALQEKIDTRTVEINALAADIPDPE